MRAACDAHQHDNPVWNGRRLSARPAPILARTTIRAIVLGPSHMAVENCPMRLGTLAFDTGCPPGLRSHPKNLIEFGLAEECRC